MRTPARRLPRRLNQRSRVASLGNHHVRCLDDRNSIIADLEGEIVHRLIGDRRGDDHPTGDVDADMGCGSASKRDPAQSVIKGLIPLCEFRFRRGLDRRRWGPHHDVQFRGIM